MSRDRQALITGVGLISSLGEGLEAHLDALDRVGSDGPVLDTTTFAPFPVHPMIALELDRQIPKRGDQRQMEAWQRIGTYAAGQALEAAGLKGSELLAGMDMIVAAGGGERDYAVDAAILSGLPEAADPGLYLNQHLLGDLRPTLFLAQLSNLLAGNISIVHGVAGSSRTFMGEESSGADAVRIACARIAAGQGELFLVGGSFNAQRADTLVLYASGGTLWKGGPLGIQARQDSGPSGGTSSAGKPGLRKSALGNSGSGNSGSGNSGSGKSGSGEAGAGEAGAGRSGVGEAGAGGPGVGEFGPGGSGVGGGMILGSVGCFLVIESRGHAERRGATPLAHIAGIRTGRCRREPGQATAVAAAQLDALRPPSDPDGTAVISGASGIGAPTREEFAWLRALELPVRATGTALGNSLEPSFPANLALAAGAIARGRLFAPLEPAEAVMEGALRQVLVTSWGHWRGETLALVTPA